MRRHSEYKRYGTRYSYDISILAHGVSFEVKGFDGFEGRERLLGGGGGGILYVLLCLFVKTHAMDGWRPWLLVCDRRKL